MVSVGLYVPLQAKPGKEADLEAFLQAGRALVEDEPGTIDWYAIKLGDGHYADRARFACAAHEPSSP